MALMRLRAPPSPLIHVNYNNSTNYPYSICNLLLIKHKQYLNNKRSLLLNKSFSPTIIARPLSAMRIAYQGVPGAYSEAAALKAFPECETLACDEFEDTFKAVELGLADKAVVPIENSLGGSIHENYDLLLKYHNRLHIIGEIQLIINHCLLALPGVIKQDLKRVLSHPQVTLNKFGLVRVNHDNTAGAAKSVADKGLRDTGVVASARAANIYGLHIIQEGIQDRKFDNITRFLILAKQPVIIPGECDNKTSIVFSLEDSPGILFKALTLFSLRDISLTKIESRPDNGRGSKSRSYFDYLFYIDFEASMAEPGAQNAIRHLQEFAKFVRVLGSYRKVDTIS